MATPLHVLIVEDSKADAQLLVHDLQKGGYEPDWERVDTAEALNAALDQRSWDLILADYVLPQFSGLEALEILKRKGPDIPFIIVSGKIGEDTAVDAMKAGANDYIVKGNTARLIPAIQRELREAEVRRGRRKAEQERDELMTLLREANEKLVVSALAAKEAAEHEQRMREELKKNHDELERRLKGVEAEAEHSAAECEAATKELESFSYAVSHDLRAPLRHIAGFSQALEEDYADKLDEQGKEYLQFVRESTLRMEELLDGMLRLSRATRAEMHRQEVDLSALAQDIAEQLRAAQPERQAEFLIQPRVVANGDEKLLRLVLENLLGNAWKFTSKRPQARVEFGTAEQDGRTVYFVRDNGVGFNQAYVGKLFIAFQRLHTEEEFPGIGIGLALVQRLVRRHGGTVWAEGAEGKGATFYFTLG